MSQTRIIRELNVMIRRKEKSFEGEHRTNRDSRAGEVIQQDIDTLREAVRYVELTFALQRRIIELEGEDEAL